MRTTSPLSLKSLRADVLDDAGRFEELASVAHDFWRIDREPDGWPQGSPRDNTRKIHTDIVVYCGLPEKIKDCGRQQIRLLARL